ncbi:capsular biosynthesis protein, partial [Acinetobacter baumannii]|nr:capsular biosynthesis protein [Acinetobacter baumannii]
MNILILVNPAKNYKYFFYNVAKSLVDLGHSVYYAYDTEKNKILFPIPEIDESSK